MERHTKVPAAEKIPVKDTPFTDNEREVLSIDGIADFRKQQYDLLNGRTAKDEVIDYDAAVDDFLANHGIDETSSNHGWLKSALRDGASIDRIEWLEWNNRPSARLDFADLYPDGIDDENDRSEADLFDARVTAEINRRDEAAKHPEDDASSDDESTKESTKEREYSEEYQAAYSDYVDALYKTGSRGRMTGKTKGMAAIRFGKQARLDYLDTARQNFQEALGAEIEKNLEAEFAEIDADDSLDDEAKQSRKLDLITTETYLATRQAQHEADAKLIERHDERGMIKKLGEKVGNFFRKTKLIGAAGAGVGVGAGAFIAGGWPVTIGATIAAKFGVNLSTRESVLAERANALKDESSPADNEQPSQEYIDALRQAISPKDTSVEYMIARANTVATEESYQKAVELHNQLRRETRKQMAAFAIGSLASAATTNIISHVVSAESVTGAGGDQVGGGADNPEAQGGDTPETSDADSNETSTDDESSEQYDGETTAGYGESFTVESGHGLVTELQEAAAAHGHELSANDAWSLHEQLTDQFGEYIESADGSSATYSMGDSPYEVGISSPGEHQFTPESQQAISDYFGDTPESADVSTDGMDTTEVDPDAGDVEMDTDNDSVDGVGETDVDVDSDDDVASESGEAFSSTDELIESNQQYVMEHADSIVDGTTLGNLNNFNTSHMDLGTLGSRLEGMTYSDGTPIVETSEVPGQYLFLDRPRSASMPTAAQDVISSHFSRRGLIA